MPTNMPTSMPISFSSLGSASSPESAASQGSSRRNLRVSFSQVDEELDRRHNRIRTLTKQLVPSASMADLHARHADNDEDEPLHSPVLDQLSEVVLRILPRRHSLNDLQTTGSQKRTILKSESTLQSNRTGRRKSDIARYELSKTYTCLGSKEEAKETRPKATSAPRLGQRKTPEPAEVELKVESGLSHLWDNCKKMSDTYLIGAIQTLEQVFVQ
ncbi:hypothetical protein GUITHDRAFT_121893 [Guillardia theta CCMP2712]|uniref:Uncharacterized protein n=1 Tax=Guillardia theta (strain CCMP2712) TaxID=905079 RepID=L1I6Q9_GUITC|nr:hypothetical protein GUITHDRAFT_121893 [Guillardia theta CCMP2712]EKX31921.1 hypothetical protein GUITHDRAFT_121893 [Guillardia theta CCMP2712]|eukprot:XP_005818901.1 hypothetical protein GUITHDRAFT_121893 [Guillardia theta CCMP2712]